ncbi:hypothetical protein QUF55_08110 [Clostridiaceae bacterium HSG29]|nr:hypothetical protein [Clostridiaceae bacterium HSG29]
MKKIVFTIALMILILSGCTKENSNLLDADDLKQELEVAQGIILELEDEINQIKNNTNQQVAECQDEIEELLLQIDKNNELNSDILFDDNLEYIGLFKSGKGLILTITGGEEFGTYLYNFEDKTISEVSEFGFEPIWSPKQNFVLIDEGTSIQRNFIILTDDSEFSSEIKGYVGNVFWIDEGKIAYSRLNESIELNASTELSNTTDLVTYNLYKDEVTTLFYGDEEVYYLPMYSAKDGILKYRKCYINNPEKSEELEMNLFK